jgi:tetraacyldisaccharide 4'-kinase
MDVDNLWYGTNHPLSLLLAPLGWVYCGVAALRRKAYYHNLLKMNELSVPVIIVGNITVGGTGKTPLVIWLADHLRRQGRRPGIVSRGYGGKARHWPQQVRPDSDVAMVGDEAVMLAASTGCPMCVGPDRPAAVEALLAHTDIDVVIADDGLQHYALGRDLEIVVIDGERRFGNGWPLPAGPLREPRSRLRTVDMVIVNGAPGADEFSMKLHQPRVRRLGDGATAVLADFAGAKVNAVAGIGNPQRFFDLLTSQGIEVTPQVFSDHHRFVNADLQFPEPLPILMTDKDAVKCRRLRCENCWVVSVDAQPDAAFVQRLNLALEEIVNG